MIILTSSTLRTLNATSIEELFIILKRDFIDNETYLSKGEQHYFIVTIQHQTKRGKHYEKYSCLKSKELDLGLLSILIGFIILIVGTKIYKAKIMSIAFEENGLFLSIQKMQIKEEYLLHYMGKNELKYLWKYVIEIKKTEKYWASIKHQ